jgi:tetratricopeptide (TPR) repeat protein
VSQAEPPGPPDAAEQARRRAELLVSAGRAREAVALLEQAVAAAPNDAATLCHLALAYLHAGDRSRQLRAAERAAAADPESEWAHRLRCDALGALDQPAEAVEAARQAVALAPREPLALLCLVKSLRANRERAEARLRADELVALAPQKPSSHESWALVALDDGRLADAEAGMRRALALDPASAVHHNNLGLVLLRQGQREAAVAAFENAARIDPTMEIAQQNLSIGLRTHLHRGLGRTLADGFLRFIPGGDRPELARLRRALAGGLAAALLVGLFAASRRLPGSFPAIFVAAMVGSLLIAPRLRLRRLSPTVQRFAASRRLVSPRLPVQRFLVTILLGLVVPLALILVVGGLLDPKVPKSRVLVPVVAAVSAFTFWRGARRRRGRGV